MLTNIRNFSLKIAQKRSLEIEKFVETKNAEGSDSLSSDDADDSVHGKETCKAQVLQLRRVFESYFQSEVIPVDDIRNLTAMLLESEKICDNRALKKKDTAAGHDSDGSTDSAESERTGGDFKRLRVINSALVSGERDSDFLTDVEKTLFIDLFHVYCSTIIRSSYMRLHRVCELLSRDISPVFRFTEIHVTIAGNESKRAKFENVGIP